MSQTLVSISSSLSPTTAADVKTYRNSLAANLAAVENLSIQQLKALAIQGLAYYNAHYNVGPTDYRVGLVSPDTRLSNLVKHTEATMGPAPSVMDERARAALLAVSLWNGGYVDTTIGTNVQALVNNTRVLSQHPEDALDRMLVYLLLKTF